MVLAGVIQGLSTVPSPQPHPSPSYSEPLPGSPRGWGGPPHGFLCRVWSGPTTASQPLSSQPVPFHPALQPSVRSKITRLHPTTETLPLVFLLPPTLFPRSYRTNSPSFHSHLKGHRLREAPPDYLNILVPPQHTWESCFLI